IRTESRERHPPPGATFTGLRWLWVGGAWSSLPHGRLSPVASPRHQFQDVVRLFQVRPGEPDDTYVRVQHLQGVLSLPVPGQGTRGAVGAEPVRLADEPGPLPPEVHHRHGLTLPVGEAVLKRVRWYPAVLADQPDPCLQRALCPAVGELPPPPHVHTPRP